MIVERENASEREHQFMAHINAESPLEIIIRGHLWIESSLIRLIEEVLPQPKALDLARYSFPQKTGLVVGLGLLRQEFAPAYLKLNVLRNRVAHDLFSAISEREQEDLIQALGPKLRFMSGIDEEKHKDEPFPEPLRAAIMTLLVELEGVRDSVIKHREEMAALHKRVEELRSRSRGCY
jgi:hypothetical protein